MLKQIIIIIILINSIKGSNEVTNEATTTDIIQRTMETTTTSDNLNWTDFPLKKDTSTDITPAVTKTDSDSPMNHHSSNELTVSSYCFCDLTLNSCDINCCCDSDCNSSILKVFQCIPELPYDHYRILSCDMSDTWLCILKSFTQIDQAEPNDQMNDNYFNTLHYHTWPEPFLSIETNNYEEGRNFYKYGDIIQLIHIENKFSKIFELPLSVMSTNYSPYCNVYLPVQYLKSYTKYCRALSRDHLIEIRKNLIQMRDFFHMQIEPNRNDLDTLISNIRIRYCYIQAKNCTFENHLMDLKSAYEEFNLKKINIKILHNFTQINWCLIEFWFNDGMNDDVNDKDGDELWLEWNIEFLNKTLNDALFSPKTELMQNTNEKIISGPLGYIINKPIIISTYEADTNSKSASKVLKYFHKYTETAEHTLGVFTTKHDKCYRSKSSREYTVNFGINEMVSCKLSIPNIIREIRKSNNEAEDDLKKTNFNEICLKIQNTQINYYLFGNNALNEGDDHHQQVYVSKLGRPQNATNQWLPLIIKNADSMAISGQYNQHLNAFICRNMLLNIKYEFHMMNKHLNAKSLNSIIQRQHLIERATLIFGERHTLEFPMDEQFEIPLVITTRFYNLNNRNALSKANRLINLKYFHIYLFAFYSVNFYVCSLIK